MECIEWTGAKTPAGYGLKRVEGKLQYVHRLAYEQEYGPIPAGMLIMHTCDNPPCVNPLHLQAGTQKDNMQDCSEKGRIQRTNAAKTHCKWGHEFTVENTWTNGKRRACKTCLRNRKAVSRA